MAKKKISTESPDFELALKELESIVERMEQGEQTLEDSLQDFERGMELSKQCQDNLKQAQLRVEKLSDKLAQDSTPPTDTADD